jgi:predicted DNA-binding protein with PD1-like motif
MRHRQLDGDAGARRFVAVFDSGEDVLPALLNWVRDRGLTAASFVGIGAFRQVELGFFDPAAREYLRTTIDEQVEVLALSGNIAVAEDQPKVHAHVVVGKRDATALGGHLMGGVVRPTLELVVTESDVVLRRTLDAATGLPLLDPEA